MRHVSPDALVRARRVRLMIFDVDGVLTDGRLWYGAEGEVLKSFHTLDGHGLKLLGLAGIATAILSGRESAAVTRRASELGIAHVLQGIERKGSAFDALLAKLGLSAPEAGCMGDDVMDLPVLRRCGLACAPHEAHARVLDCAHLITSAPAGAGAAREICDLLMQSQDSLQAALARYLA